MNSEDIEKWKQSIRSSAMSILKDVQKLLTYAKEHNADKITMTSNDIAGSASDLFDSISDQLNDTKDVCKEILVIADKTKKSVVAAMKLCESLANNVSDNELQTDLKNECKLVAANIKEINGSISKLTEADLADGDDDDATVDYTKLLEKLDEHTKSAASSLSVLQEASENKDQPQLVSSAKNLSSQCGELLQHSRKFKLDALGESLKSQVLNAISLAKGVYKSANPQEDQSAEKLEAAKAVTLEGLERLMEAFNTKLSRNAKRNSKDSDDDLDDLDDEPKLPEMRGPSDVLSPKDASKQLQKEFSSRDPEKVFKVQEELGKGASGSVYRAVHKETKKVVAIKKMKVGVTNLSSTVKEIKIMKDLKSPYTLKYYGTYNKDDTIWIIMEYCDGGSLQDIIDARENEDICLTEPQMSQITVQVLKALEYLHSMKKIHRDIKAGNILLNSAGYAKLADFGISAQQVGDEKRTTTIGSSYWMAPETLMGGGYDSKADIWSLGITLLEMAEGIPPLIEEQPHKAAFRIVNDPPPKLSNPQAWTKVFNDFVARCLTKNPDQRPTASQLLQHPFLSDAVDVRDAVVDLINWNEKDKKKKKKKSVEVEDEMNLDVHFEDGTVKTLLVPGHATAEDVCRQSSELTSHVRDIKTYALYASITEGTKTKEKQIGPYDMPIKILRSFEKKYKKKKGGEVPYKFVYK